MTKFLNTLVSATIALPLTGSIATAAPQFSDTEMQSALEYLTAQVEHQEKRIETLENSVRNLGGQPKPPTEQKVTDKPKEAKVDQAPPKTYVIKEGDMISEIAKANNISRELLLEANQMQNGQQIYIGDTLVIPTAPSQIKEQPKKDTTKTASAPESSDGSFTTYTVRFGDTLSRISRAEGVSVAAIKSANNLRSDSIAGGQKLKIPAKGNTSTASTTTTAPSTQNVSAPADSETYGLYTVQRGDTIYSLDRDFYTTQAEIQKLNELKTTRIFPGDELVVPTSQFYAKSNLAKN